MNSLARRRLQAYHNYLKSPSWQRRRKRWFVQQRNMYGKKSVFCRVCGVKRPLELHHLTYENISKNAGILYANESHEDLIPLCPRCHEAVHLILDTKNRRDYISRKDATFLAMQRIKNNIQAQLDAQQTLF